MAAKAIVAGSRLEATLRDLTISGCKLELPATLVPGQRLTLTLAGLHPFGATVTWGHSGHAGISFISPLHPAVVDFLVKRQSA